MAITLGNFVRSVLSQDATAADNTLVLALAAAPLRDPPDASEDAPGVLVLQDAPTAPSKIEVIYYTGRTIVDNNVTLTGCTRAQESTTAQSWTAGTPTFQGITAGVIDSKLDASGTSAAAAKLATARNFSMSGVVLASAVPFDGSADLALVTTIPNGALTFAMVSGLQAALDAKLPLAGGTMSGALTTANAGQSLIVRQGSSGAMANATGNLGGLSVRGAGAGNAAYMQFLTDSFGAYFGIDTDNQLKIGGYSMGAVARRIVHEGLSAVSLGGTLATSGGITSGGSVVGTGFTSTTSGYSSAGAAAGYSFNDRTAGTTWAHFATGGSMNVWNSNIGTILEFQQGTGIATFHYNATGPDFIATSDPNLKDRIHRLQRGIADLRRMLPREYVKYADRSKTGPGKKEVGFLATEVQEVLPEAAFRRPDGYWGVSYGQITALLAASILELDDRLMKKGG